MDSAQATEDHGIITIDALGVFEGLANNHADANKGSTQTRVSKTAS